MTGQPWKLGLTHFVKLLDFTPHTKVQPTKVDGRDQDNGIVWETPVIQEEQGGRGVSFTGATDPQKGAYLCGKHFLGGKLLPAVIIQIGPDDFPHVLKMLEFSQSACLS